MGSGINAVISQWRGVLAVRTERKRIYRSGVRGGSTHVCILHPEGGAHACTRRCPSRARTQSAAGPPLKAGASLPEGWRAPLMMPRMSRQTQYFARTRYACAVKYHACIHASTRHASVRCRATTLPTLHASFEGSVSPACTHVRHATCMHVWHAAIVAASIFVHSQEEQGSRSPPLGAKPPGGCGAPCKVKCTRALRLPPGCGG